jgi:hypothetical protein
VSADDENEPVINHCNQCGAGIGNTTGLCSACAAVEAGDLNRNGDGD